MIGGAMAGAILIASGGAWAQAEPPRPRGPMAQANGAPDSGLSPEVRQSIGCAVTGTVATAGSIWLGGENLVNLIAGGVVAPQNRAVLYVGLVGVVFASFCAIGQALTPLYVYYMDAPGAAPTNGTPTIRTRAADADPAPRPAFQAGVLARVAENAARRANWASAPGVVNTVDPLVATVVNGTGR